MCAEVEELFMSTATLQNHPTRVHLNPVRTVGTQHRSTLSSQPCEKRSAKYGLAVRYDSYLSRPLHASFNVQVIVSRQPLRRRMSGPRCLSLTVRLSMLCHLALASGQATHRTARVPFCGDEQLVASGLCRATPPQNNPVAVSNLPREET